MSKKYEISKEAQVLLRLLRIALGTEPMGADGTPVEPFPQAIDWREVIRLSYEQKVSALAVDGLKASGFDIRQLADSADLQPSFASWFDDLGNNEESYAYYLTVLLHPLPDIQGQRTEGGDTQGIWVQHGLPHSEPQESGGYRHLPVG